MRGAWKCGNWRSDGVGSCWVPGVLFDDRFFKDPSRNALRVSNSAAGRLKEDQSEELWNDLRLTVSETDLSGASATATTIEGMRN
jgi:hypothetical protein